jgi:outer membrane cobalamin receptor
LNSKDKKPVEYATISLPDNRLWSVADENGIFILKNVPHGKTSLTILSLGYLKMTFELEVKENIFGKIFYVPEDNLALDEVVVTAKQKTNDLTTSYTIDRTTLDHSQIINVSDVLSLLPGGKSAKGQDLASSGERFVLRGETGEKGNASFGTAVEVDGVRLQNNSSFDETKGADVRNISSTNIESIEIITGIPSVEHGDLSNGLVKLNTKKGKTPLTVEWTTSPNTKQAAVSKGFSLPNNAGTFNTSFEHTKSISDPASPYTSYDRNTFSLKYANTLNKSRGMPLMFDAGFSGNIGGYDSKADPDKFKDTYVKKRDNNFKGNFILKWLLNKPWITNIELSGSMNYSDKFSKANSNESRSSSQAAIHSTENGYFIATDYDENPDAPIILIPPGYWSQLYYHDNKPISQTTKLKADWGRKFGIATNKIMLGGELNRNGNKGKGTYYDDMRYAPTWHEYRYDEKPFMNNVALYIEEKFIMPLHHGISKIEITAGVRSDLTIIKGSEYGAVQSLSPRFNAKYTIWEKANKTIRALSIYAGWGKTVKLPSFEVLYPRPTYSNDLAFAPGTMADGKTFYAYYTLPGRMLYNPNLKWQHNKQLEIGVETKIKDVKISMSFFRNKTLYPYINAREYTTYSYNLTEQKALNDCPIPSIDRIYTIDRQTGIVTVSDKNGVYENRQLDYTTRNTYKSNNMYINGSPVERKGIEWVIDFPKIPSIKTSFKLDGNYYYYKSADETLIAWKPSSVMADGTPFKYVGYYVGSSGTATSSSATSDIISTPNVPSASVSNGDLSKQLNTNLTVITHIPTIRWILSLKIEASLYHYTRRLSEYSGGKRGFALRDPEGYAGDDTDIYKGNVYVGLYPLYYTAWENPETKIPFAEKFTWAKENDPALYNELAKLVVKSNTNYFFNPNTVSSYLSANIKVTKEIGDFVSISFYANNFFNNMALVKSSNNNTESTLYNSNYIPRFYYGLSLTLKL